MKKNQLIAQSFAFIAAGFLAQACGSSSNNISPVTATQQTGTTCTTTNSCVTTGLPGQVYNSCSAYNGQMTTVTSNGTNVQVCKYLAANGEIPYMNATAMTISSGASSASGGTLTGLQLDAGDELEVISMGHYSPSGGVCDSGNGGGDISVLGNSNKSQDPTINPTNGLNDGLWFAFENTSGQYSTPVNATVQYNGNVNQSGQYIHVPMGSATNTLVMGYNVNGSIGCGDMEIYYAVIRCADSSGNTYTCN